MVLRGMSNPGWGIQFEKMRGGEGLEGLTGLQAGLCGAAADQQNLGGL